MAQPSVACYFNTRKRSAIDELKIHQTRKILKLDESCITKTIERLENNNQVPLEESVKKTEHILNKIVCNSTITKNVAKKSSKTPKVQKKIKEGTNQSIQDLLANMGKKETEKPTESKTTNKRLNAMDKVSGDGPSLNEIRQKLTRSSRLAELKASISRFNQKSDKLKEIEKKTATITSQSDTKKLQTFKSIELEVELSPQKNLSPQKAYLSPKKDLTPKKNLLNLLSPTKNAVALSTSPSKQLFETSLKPALTLPFKYRYLAEIFRSIDTISQILFNRKEIITYRKLKPAVEDMLKRNLTMKHLAQLRQIYPDAYSFAQEKIRMLGDGMRQERWELVLKPCVDDDEYMTANDLLVRRRKLYDLLLDKVKHYHQEFLQSLDPPMNIPKIKITRWHPEFDIERVPDVEESQIPAPPTEEKLTTGQEVLQKARELFHCNTRMEQALERLKAAKEAQTEVQDEKPKATSLLKGIPKALLEKVRQKQAAKALLTMTRSADKEKQALIYSRLSEIARHLRNLFVAEKKSVLLLDVVIEKLGNSYPISLTRPEMVEHLKIISGEVNGWLIFHDIRNTTYLKLAKNADLSLVLNKLESLAKIKMEM